MNSTLIDVRRRVVFLEDEFQAVGQRLAQAEHADLRERNADAIRPSAILHPGGDPALRAAPDTPPPSSARQAAGDLDRATMALRMLIAASKSELGVSGKRIASLTHRHSHWQTSLPVANF